MKSVEKGTLEEAISALDYEAISLAMKALDWKWGSDSKSPTPSELKETVVEYVNELKVKKIEFDDKGEFRISTSSGGIRVDRSVSNDSDLELWHIKFEVSVGMLIGEKNENN